jgi:hypothetical protein
VFEREIFGPKKGEVRGKRRRSENVLFTKHYSGAQNKKNEMGGPFGTYRVRRVHTG